MFDLFRHNPLNKLPNKFVVLFLEIFLFLWLLTVKNFLCVFITLLFKAPCIYNLLARETD